MKIRLPKLYDWLNQIDSWWRKASAAETLAAKMPTPPSAPRRLERVVLSEGVASTLFDDYAAHCVSPRGAEEIGWILMGLRQDTEAIALAALPAGAERDASQVHIRFNADAQGLASRILRQKDKRLQILGVVHTHPGDMCHPSSGDLAGDSAWVAKLRHGDAVFGIGTAGGSAGCNGHAPSCGELRFSWYALGVGDIAYRPLPTRVEAGPDLAAPLRAIWATLEANAAALEKLHRLFARVQVDRAEGGLAVKIALAEPQNRLRVLLKGSEARYYWERAGALSAVDPREPHLERAVLLILAELANEQATEFRNVQALIES
jgi:Prokaryotic homologs of the JAB domain